MKALFPLNLLNSYGRRFFFRWVAHFVSCFILSQSVNAQLNDPSASIQHPEPSREWLGKEYADTVIALVQKNHPELKLTIDLKNVELLQNKSPEDSTRFERLADLPEVIIESKHVQLIISLAAGNPIDLIGDSFAPQVELKQWVHAQPENSISPDKFMEKAIVLANGNLIDAWVLAWNYACENWIASSTRNFGPIRNFISITGERQHWKGGVQYVVVPPNKVKLGKATVFKNNKVVNTSTVPRYLEMVVTKRGDDFSYLYHRLGVELLAMVIAKQTGSAIAGRAVGISGALGEYKLFKKTAGLVGESKKRVFNDITAAESGARLFNLVEKKRPLAISTEPLGPKNYLKPNHKKYGSKYQLQAGRPAIYFGSDVDPKFWQASMSVEELTYRFFHATRYDEKIMNPVILASGNDYERLHRGLTDYVKSTVQDEKLNEYIQNYLHGMRGKPAVRDVNDDIDLNPATNKDFAQYQDKNFDFKEYESRIHYLLTRVLAQKRQALPASKGGPWLAGPKTLSNLSQEPLNYCRQLFK